MTHELEFRLPRVVDATMLAAARVCQQQFAWTHGFGLRKTEAEADVHLVAGGAFAAARETLYTALYEGAAKAEAWDRTRAALESAWGGFQPPEKSPKTLENVWKGLREYARVFDPPNDRIEPLALGFRPAFEWAFSIPLTAETTRTPEPWPRHPETGEPFVYAGRLDELGMLAGTSGIPVVLDDKTTSRFEAVPTWTAGLQMRGQMIGYTWAVRQLGLPALDTVVVRQIAFRTSGVEVRESPLIVFSEHLLERWLDSTRRTLEAVVRAAESGAWIRAFGEACVSWGRPCEFLEACRARDSADQLEGFAVQRWNPLERAAAIAALAEETEL